MNPRRLLPGLDLGHRGMRSMEDYDIDAATGFFPPEPLPRLDGQFEIWENALDEAVKKLSLGEDTREAAKAKRADGESWRATIRSMPQLETACLGDDLRLLQRAHKVLAFLIQFFVHSHPPSEDKTPMIVPKCLAIPIVDVSRILGIAPVLTFADTVLWNAEPVDPRLPLSPSNVRFIHTFSGTNTEHEFYVSSMKAEMRGVEILRIVDSYVHLPNPTDVLSMSKTSRDLMRLAAVVQDLTEIMGMIKNHVDPHSFYWEVRHWYKGTPANGPDTSRWIYEGVPDSDKLDLSGPSAGQSTVMHAIDVFLDVDHKQEQRRTPAPSEANKKADKGFMERMWKYMPGAHQQYLHDLRAIPTPIRSLAKESPRVREAYDLSVLSLKKFRDSHIQVACLYVISMARSTPPGTPEEAKERAELQVSTGPSKGTGGNDLASLLKSTRDATNRTVLSRK
ncbi:Indoleamine 2,3-dioxygenase [Amylostereum chailletii]|nr:Indoleamine 2,3-dioxygenase [Amylostereum chailletii]